MRCFIRFGKRMHPWQKLILSSFYLSSHAPPHSLAVYRFA
jgi:hypothetical protein